MLESKIEKASCAAALKLGWWGIKLSPQFIKGIPDRMFIGYGKVVFIEYKQPGKNPTKMQEYIHNKFRKFGHEVYVCRSVEDTKEVLNGIT